MSGIFRAVSVSLGGGSSSGLSSKSLLTRSSCRLLSPCRIAAWCLIEPGTVPAARTRAPTPARHPRVSPRNPLGVGPRQVSVPLMMTVKAVVTFENFKAGSVERSNFDVPAPYKRSRRMSKELYMAGVSEAAAAAGASGGGGAIGANAGGGAAAASESDDEEEEEEEEVEVEEDEEDMDDERRGHRDGQGDMSDREMMRRRAAAGDAFDDDEEVSCTSGSWRNGDMPRGLAWLGLAWLSVGRPILGWSLTLECPEGLGPLPIWKGFDAGSSGRFSRTTFSLLSMSAAASGFWCASK